MSLVPLYLALAGLSLVGTSEVAMAAIDEEAKNFTRYDDLFKKYGTYRDVPWRWLKAICMNESNLGRHPSVVRGMASPGGEDGWSDDGLSRGLMQLTVDTANRSRVRPGTTIADLDSPEISVDCAALYVRELMRFYFPGDREGVIRGYNGGPGWAKSSQAARSMTASYYARFQSHLAEILQAQPGDEYERG